MVVWYPGIMRGPTKRRGGLIALACVALGACNGHTYKDGYFSKGGLRYHVATLDPAQWQQLGFADNDLAWVNRSSPHVLSTNATCDLENHGDPSLEVLTTHLLFGFSDKTLNARETKTIDGRQALISSYVAKLDGVPVEIVLAVLKKNDCVHDFIYISPPGQAAAHRAQFELLLTQFAAERT